MFEKYDAYKDSELPSFGSVPIHWEIVPLCSITTLKSITNVVNVELLSVYLDKGVIRFDDVTEKRTNVTSLDLSKYQLVEEGDFVLNNQQAWRGSVGVSIYRGIVSPAYLVLKLSPKVDAKFANYFFRNSAMVSQYLINSKGVGTIQRNLYWQHLKRSDVVLPPREEQIEIAEFLNQKTAEIDQAIAIKEQQIVLLNERKQIVIQKAVTQGLDPNVPMKDSGVEWIGQIPEHWEILPLTKYSTRVDYRGKTPEKVEEGRLLVTTRNIKNGILDYEISKEYIKESQYKEVMSRGIPKKGDILFTMEAPLGHSAVVDREDIAIAQRIIKFRLDSERLNSYFINYYFQTDIFQNYLYGLGTGSTALGIKASKLGLLKLIAPNLYEQEKIVAFLITEEDKFNSAFELLNQEISKLKEYKTTLINDAVTGKIKVA